MTNYEMKLLEEPFQRIKSGMKTVEVRLNDEKRQKLYLGDTINFKKLPEQEEVVSVKVVDLQRYKTFKDLIQEIPLKYLGYSNGDTEKDFLDDCYNIYTKEQEQKYGVLAIGIKKL